MNAKLYCLENNGIFTMTRNACAEVYNSSPAFKDSRLRELSLQTIANLRGYYQTKRNPTRKAILLASVVEDMREILLRLPPEDESDEAQLIRVSLQSIERML